MRATLYSALALAIAIPAFVAAYEMEVEFGEDATFVDFEGNFGDDYNASVYLSNIYVGIEKDARVLFVTPEHYENKPTEFSIVNIDGDAVGVTCGTNLIGMFQFVDIYPADDCEISVKFELTKNLKVRIANGFLKTKDFVPIGGGVKNVGSVISKKYAGGGPGKTSYFEQTGVGWTIAYDADSGYVTLKGEIDQAYVDIESGCFDVGIATWK